MAEFPPPQSRLGFHFPSQLSSLQLPWHISHHVERKGSILGQDGPLLRKQRGAGDKAEDQRLKPDSSSCVLLNNYVLF